MSLKKSISMTVNGLQVTAEIEPRKHLVDFLREDLHLKGPHLGCEQGACGACTVKVNGQIIRGCLFLAIQANGAIVETIEGLTQSYCRCTGYHAIVDAIMDVLEARANGQKIKPVVALA